MGCVGGLRDERQAREDLLRPPGALDLIPPRRWQQERAGSLITINSLCVAIGVQLYLELLAGTLRSSHWTRLLWAPGQGLQVDEGPVAAAEACSRCRPGSADAPLPNS